LFSPQNIPKGKIFIGLQNVADIAEKKRIFEETKYVFA